MENEKVMINGVKYVPAAKSQAVNADGLKYCIVRTYSAGVFAGYVAKCEAKDGHFVIKLIKSRRLWKWVGASLSQVAIDGFINYDEVKIPMAVPVEDLSGGIEVIECSQKAQESIEGSPVWKR